MWNSLHRLNVELHRLNVELHRLIVELHRLNVELHRLNVELHRLIVELHRLIVELHRLNVELHRLIVELHTLRRLLVLWVATWQHSADDGLCRERTADVDWTVVRLLARASSLDQPCSTNPPPLPHPRPPLVYLQAYSALSLDQPVATSLIFVATKVGRFCCTSNFVLQH